LVLQTTEQDIDYALKHFETHNGEIAQILLSACVFRRQHYEQEFLPKLLTPRVIPDVPDIKAKFINRLFSMNKISHSLYARYREACLAEARTLQGKKQSVIGSICHYEDSDNLPTIIEPTHKQCVCNTKIEKESLYVFLYCIKNSIN
jgi:hypothetical protein